MATSSPAIRPEDFNPTTKSEGLESKTRPSLSYWKDAWIRLKRNKQALASLWIIIGLLTFTVAGPWIWTVDPSEQLMGRVSEAPGFRNSVMVLPELASWEEPTATLTESDAQKAAFSLLTADQLPAPAGLEFIGPPSVDSVRLRWSPVSGAEGYTVYRSTHKPEKDSDLGVPVGGTDAPEKVGYQDQFDLKIGKAYYSVVAKKGDAESKHFATIETDLKPGITLADAQLLSPGAQPGQMLTLPARPLGTDQLGRDLLARLIAGARVSLFIGFFAPLFSVLLGVIIGGTAGYVGGRTDHALMRFTDFVLALPFLLFMILFKVAFGAQAGESGVMPMLVAMVALSWTGPARLTRGQILQLRESEFVQASKLLGAKPAYLLFRHLLPNTLGVILVSLTFAIPSAIFTEAFLSFIGMGVVPPTPSWGSLCDDGIKTFLTHPHEFIFPAAIISVTVLAFNLLGDGLRDALDPKMRSLS